jgi:hypothetical protein
MSLSGTLVVIIKNMDIFHSVFAARLIFILGIVNFLLLLLMFFTCRCLPTSKIGKSLMNNHRYKQFYKYHCYLWYFLGLSVVIHALFAIMLTGIPF